MAKDLFPAGGREARDCGETSKRRRAIESIGIEPTGRSPEQVQVVRRSQPSCCIQTNLNATAGSVTSCRSGGLNFLTLARASSRGGLGFTNCNSVYRNHNRYGPRNSKGLPRLEPGAGRGAKSCPKRKRHLSSP